MHPNHEAAIMRQRAAHERMIAAVDALDRLVTDEADDEARTAAQTEFDTADTEYRSATGEVERQEALSRAREVVPRDLPPATAKNTDPEARQGQPYTKGGRSYFRDLMQARSGNQDAYQRLVENNRHRVDVEPDAQLRAGMTQAAGAGGEFIYPVWLEEYVPVLRAGRPFADACNSSTFAEDTNSINIPKLTTGASVAVQSDGGAVSNTDLVTTSVTAQAQTFAGRTVAAYQDIDLGASYIDQMIFQDLLAAYWQQYDSALINSTVANAKGWNQLAGTNAVTYTDATPTGPEIYSPFMQAKAQIEKSAFVGVDFAALHPSTWDWFLSTLDTQNRPLALATDSPAVNRMAAYLPQGAQGPAGNIAGIPVIVDANIPVNLGAGTNQAVIGMFNRQTLVTYEGRPRFKVADQTSVTTLQYQFVMYGYAAWAFGRQPKMISVIGGTGLIVQAGF